MTEMLKCFVIIDLIWKLILFVLLRLDEDEFFGDFERYLIALEFLFSLCNLVTEFRSWSDNRTLCASDFCNRFELIVYCIFFCLRMISALALFIFWHEVFETKDIPKIIMTLFYSIACMIKTLLFLREHVLAARNRNSSERNSTILWWKNSHWYSRLNCFSNFHIKNY